MTTGLFASLAINVLVGFYFAWFYPRRVRRTFAGGRMPRAFGILLRVLPSVGVALIIGSILYGILLTAGALGH